MFLASSPPPNPFFDTADKILIIFGLITCVVTILGWITLYLKNRIMSQRITIRLVDHNDPDKIILTLEHKPQRRTASRAEIQGLMGNISLGRNYSVAYFKNPRFLKTIERVQTGESDEIDIPVTEEESLLFRLNKLQG